MVLNKIDESPKVVEHIPLIERAKRLLRKRPASQNNMEGAGLHNQKISKIDEDLRSINFQPDT